MGMSMVEDHDKIADAYRAYRQAIGTKQEGIALRDLNRVVRSAHFELERAEWNAHAERIASIR
jgi:hypothetical protein